MSLLSVTVRDVLFVHWPMGPADLAPAVPDWLDIATRDGRAWLGAVALANDVGDSPVDPFGQSFGRSFAQVNLRTYVRHDGDLGVYFLSLDSAGHLAVAVARRFFHLPYYRADAALDGNGAFRFRSQRTHAGQPPAALDVEYEPTGEAFVATDDPHADFCIERYRYFAEDDRGRRYVGTIDHEPWDLREATASIRRNGLPAGGGLPAPSDGPVVHYSPGVEISTGRPRRP